MYQMPVTDAWRQMLPARRGLPHITGKGRRVAPVIRPIRGLGLSFLLPECRPLALFMPEIV